VTTRVLVVEDEAVIALDLSLRLERMGYRIVGRAASGAEALALAAVSPPDVVLMDIVLHGHQDGIETARMLQERLNAAVIYLTAYADEATLARARSTNPYGYLLKPIREEELRCAIELAIDKRRLDTALAEALAQSRSAEDLSRARNVVLDHCLFERTGALSDVNARLAEATLELQQALRAKDMFLARMSHELRTPLSAIIGFSDTLLLGLHGALNEEQARHVGTIQRSSEHLLSLINDLLDLSKITAGHLDLRPEMVDCAAAIEEVFAVAAPLAADKHLLLTTHVAQSDLKVHADRRALQQILLNLLSNAIKFTDRGSITLVCRQRSEDDQTWLLFEVRDTGLGLSKEDQSELFHPYRQLGSHSGGAQAGTGLGLHLSLKLAQQMSGTIRVGGAPGVGSVFTLMLPAEVGECAT
jgi:signal transduction histidine kinase